jgi:hypothetical protein
MCDMRRRLNRGELGVTLWLHATPGEGVGSPSAAGDGPFSKVEGFIGAMPDMAENQGWKGRRVSRTRCTLLAKPRGAWEGN